MQSRQSARSQRTAFTCTRRVTDAAISYELVMPAARLLGSEPLLDTPIEAAEPGRLAVAVSRPLIFDETDASRGRGFVTIPPGTPLGFDGSPGIRHGMVSVTITASLPETVWRLDRPLLPSRNATPA